MNKRRPLKASDFKICIMFILVFCTSWLLLFYSPQPKANLMASTQNIYGAFTSIFVHKDSVHLILNANFAFLFYTFYFISSVIAGSKNENFVLLGIWLSAILANFISIFLEPYKIVGGSSGLVFAFLGGTVALAFINGVAEPISRNKRMQFVIGIFLLIVHIVTNLVVSTDTNVGAHMSSFFIMFLLVLTKHLVTKKG